MKRIWFYIFSLLALILVLIWTAVLVAPGKTLKIIACDVGQGDAILLTYKNIQILTDGGVPNGMVINCLSRHMPFYDRNLEVVINTHPQLDHYGGLTEVFRRYKVDYFLANALESSSSEYQLLKKEVGGSGARVVNPNQSTDIRYGLLHLDVFWPTLSFLESEGYKPGANSLGSFTSKRDPNDFSVQVLVSFGEFDALLTGDVGHNMAPSIIPNFESRSVEYIKIPHHGSKYGLAEDYLQLIQPSVAVISSGKNNYGHPTQEILDLLSSEKIQTFRTDLNGDVIVETDGEDYWLRN